MKKYAKIIEGKLVFPKKEETFENTTIENPTEVQLLRLGFKEYIETPMPEQKEWFNLQSSYIEIENKIYQKWEYVKQDEPNIKYFIVMKIQEKYDINDESALINKGIQNSNDPDYIEYRNFVNDCKDFAGKKMNEYHNV